MYDIKTSKHFEKRVDEKSGAEYYVLKTYVATQQQGFYFVNPCMDKDARYLWFYCTFPPAEYRTLGLVDFTTDEVRHFPDAHFHDVTPIVDEETGDVIFANHRGIYRRSPNPNEPTELICNLPSEIVGRTRKEYLVSPATHLTFSPDKTELFFDSYNAGGCIAGTFNLTTKEFKVWVRPEFLRNHGQINPVHKDIALMAEEFEKDENGNWRSIRTDENGVFMRLWTVNRNGEEKYWAPLNLEKASHEWWSADGSKIYYCKYSNGNNGICGIDIFTGEHKLYAPVSAWHGFSSKDDTLFVFDENDGFYRGCPSRVGLYNTKTETKVYFNSQNPPLNPPDKPNNYHLDPHPRFNAQEKYIVFTTAMDGHTDVAVAITKDIVALTEK